MAGTRNNETSGQKFDTYKARVELISTIATIKKAQVMGYGAQKYGVNNWRKGLAWSRVIGALLRHILAWMAGEDNDQETGFSHLAHAACCIDFLLEYEETHKAFDDRYKSIEEDPVPVNGQRPPWPLPITPLPGMTICKNCGFTLDAEYHKNNCLHGTI